MNDLERFKAHCRGEPVDYVPIFGFAGAPGMSGGAMAKTYQRLVETGMPEDVGGGTWLSERIPLDGWHRYWGVTQPIDVDFFAGGRAKGIASEKRIEDGFEIIEHATGAITRQVIDNDITYCMPDYVRHHVRDRASWEVYRDLVTPGEPWPAERIDEEGRRFADRDRPLCIGVGGTWGSMRSLMGPEAACTVLYDDPALVRDIMDFFAWYRQTYVFPVIDRLRPEIVAGWEDMCYNHGMLVSPAHFREYATPQYREIAAITADCDVTLTTIDCDGNVMELVDLLVEAGVESLYPFECHGGNDCFAVRRKHPNFVMFGWLEKECVNEGGAHTIREEIMSKVPPLLETKRYFPNGDHGLQPLVTFESLCMFQTLLHEVTGNPEGEFPRISPP